MRMNLPIQGLKKVDPIRMPEINEYFLVMFSSGKLCIFYNTGKSYFSKISYISLTNTKIFSGSFPSEKGQKYYENQNVKDVFAEFYHLTKDDLTKLLLLFNKVLP